MPYATYICREREVGLFCAVLGLFCTLLSLFPAMLGLFCTLPGLFCAMLGLFCTQLGLFCSVLVLFCVIRISVRYPCRPLPLWPSHTHTHSLTLTHKHTGHFRALPVPASPDRHLQPRGGRAALALARPHCRVLVRRRVALDAGALEGSFAFD